MIGPSSGTSGISGREVVDNPVAVKRKVFEDLDIDGLCEEVCQTEKKRFFAAETRTIVDDSTTQTTHLVDASEFSSSAGHDLLTNGTGSVARLEVLVVDGNWDPSNLQHSQFTEMSNTIVDDSEIHGLTDVQSMENGYGTILSYWESANPTETIQNDPCNVEIPVNCSRPVSTISCPPVEDQDNENLSWLLDFKLDSLIEAPEERSTFPTIRDTHNVSRNRYNSSATRANGTSSYVNDVKRNYSNQNDSVSTAGVSSLQPETNKSTVANGTYTFPDTRSFAISRYGGPKKPPFTYTELIEHALQEKGELTVSAIYQWISEHFPYYKSNDDRWKNSVRHNLSINPHFRKGSKAPHGAGHLWAIANKGDTRPRQLMTNLNNLPAQRQFVKNPNETINLRKPNNVTSQIVTMDEVEAATASIIQPEETNVVTNSVTLEHCAEQILSGMKREVEVQYLVPIVVSGNETEQENVQIEQTEETVTQCPAKDTERDCWNVLADFLNPVSKEEVAEECGLIGENYLVTDLNPTALGLNMVEPEIITPENLFGEELSFQFYELTSPSQLQSA